MILHDCLDSSGIALPISYSLQFNLNLALLRFLTFSLSFCTINEVFELSLTPTYS